MKELRKAVDKAGSVRALADELEVDRRAVYNWFYRKSVPPLQARLISLLYPGLRRQKLEDGK